MHLFSPGNFGCLCLRRLLAKARKTWRGRLPRMWNLPPQSGHWAGGWIGANHSCHIALSCGSFVTSCSCLSLTDIKLLLVLLFDSFQPLEMSYSKYLDILMTYMIIRDSLINGLGLFLLNHNDHQCRRLVRGHLNSLAEWFFKANNFDINWHGIVVYYISNSSKEANPLNWGSTGKSPRTFFASTEYLFISADPKHPNSGK